MRSRTLCLLATGTWVSGAVFAAAYAQNSPAVPNAAIPTQIPGIGIVPPPPAGFNTLVATPVERSRYAVPPMPDPHVAPGAYRAWERAVAAPQKRDASPMLEQIPLYNGPNQKAGEDVPQGLSSAAATSNNWSGYVYVDSNNPFKTEAVLGVFTVPTAHQAFGSCTGGWDYSSLWIGVDGWNSNDVFQAGVEVDAYCSSGTTTPYYSAWIEWYPYSETRVSSPVINPGDLLAVEVWNTSPTAGYAYFYDYSSEASAEYTLTAPSGTTLVGNSVEWIVERPGVGGGLATLTNYIDSAWSNGVAWNYTASSPTYYVIGSPPPTGTLEQVTMVDNNGLGISSTVVEAGDFLWFQDFGSACGRTGAPPC
ncbi:MAG: hypothetical protein JO267_10240 [Alphaproteobacteria bacterium]|nr:hypothetical protein [Alphaproteobacteria bacterium]